MPNSTASSPALLLVAAELEAEILFGSEADRPAWIEVCVAGVGTQGDAAARAAIKATSAAVIVNPGFAGGLRESAEPGAAYRVTRWKATDAAATFEGAEVPADVRRLAARLGARTGSAITVEVPAGDTETRRRLAASGADLVEMEGARWARAAFDHGLPFVSLRIISDRADSALPRPRHELLTADCRVRWGRWLIAAAARPAQLPSAYRRLREARSDWRRATKRLRELGRLLTDWQRGARTS